MTVVLYLACRIVVAQSNRVWEDDDSVISAFHFLSKLTVSRLKDACKWSIRLLVGEQIFNCPFRIVQLKLTRQSSPEKSELQILATISTAFASQVERFQKVTLTMTKPISVYPGKHIFQASIGNKTIWTRICEEKFCQSE